MITKFTLIIFSLFATLTSNAQEKEAAAEAAKIEPALDKKFVELQKKKSFNENDVRWLKERVKEGGANECLSIAFLYRYDKKEYEDDFRKYFKVDTNVTGKPQKEEEINKAVNGVLQAYKGRPVLEVVTRIYMKYKDSSKVNIQKGEKGDMKIYLEKVFRASVLTGVFNPSKEGLDELTAHIDAFEMSVEKPKK